MIRRLQTALLVGAAWTAAALLSRAVSGAAGQDPVIWVPSGVAMVLAVLGLGRRPTALVAIGVAAFAVEAAAGRTLAQAGSLAAAHGLEALLATLALQSPALSPPGGEKPRFGRVMAAALPATAAAAVVAALLGGDRLLPTWRAHYLGAVLLGPSAASWRAVWAFRGRPWTRLLEALTLAATLLWVSHVTFVAAPAAGFRPFPYVVLPFLAWAAIRFGAAGASVASLTVAIEGARHTLQGLGPFAVAGQSTAEHVWQVQFFVAIVCVSTLVLADALEGRKRALAALSESERRLGRERDLFRQAERSAHVGSWRLDLRDRRVVLSEEAARLAGFEDGVPFDLRLEDVVEKLVEPADREGIGEALSRLGTDAASRSHEFRARRSDGTTRWLRAEGGDVAPGDEGRLLAFGTVRDVTEARGLEAQLREMGETLRAVVDASPLAVITLDRETRLRLWNPAAVEMLAGGRTLAEGMALSDLVGPAGAATLAALLGRGEAVAGLEIEWRGEHDKALLLRTFAAPLHDGEGAVVGTVALLEDVTERRLVDEALQMAQRLEVLVTLAGGVAHDFNNLLTVVINHVSLARRKLPGESSARSHLERAAPALDRAAELAGAMLTYAGGGRAVVATLDFAALLRQRRPLLEAAVPPHITFEVDLPDRLPPVETSEADVHQIVTALLTNAVEAIAGRRGHVRLSASTRLVQEGDTSLSLYTGRPLDAGIYVVLEVSDDGCGIRPANLARLFDPFFTTKFVGRGLGLASLLGIVRSHRGAVTVESQPNQGSRFQVLLPALDARSVERTAPAGREGAPSDSTGPRQAPAG